MSRTTQQMIDRLRGFDLPYGDEILEILQSMENRISQLELQALKPTEERNE